MSKLEQTTPNWTELGTGQFLEMFNLAYFAPVLATNNSFNHDFSETFN